MRASSGWQPSLFRPFREGFSQDWDQARNPRFSRLREATLVDLTGAEQGDLHPPARRPNNTCRVYSALSSSYIIHQNTPKIEEDLLCPLSPRNIGLSVVSVVIVNVPGGEHSRSAAQRRKIFIGAESRIGPSQLANLSGRYVSMNVVAQENEHVRVVRPHRFHYWSRNLLIEHDPKPMRVSCRSADPEAAQAASRNGEETCIRLT